MAFTYLLPITYITAGISPRVELLNSSGGSLSFTDGASARIATAISGSNYYLYTTTWPSSSLPFIVKVSNHSTGSLLGIAAFNTYDVTTSNLGAGGIETTLNVVDGSSIPIQGVELWVTTDVGGGNTVAGSAYTDNFGNVTFYLDSGTYYVWKQKSGYSFSNPAGITV